MMEPLTDTAPVLVRVVHLTDEYLGYDLRTVTEEALSRLLHVCEPGSSTHRQLLEERRRRRERWRKVEE